MELIKKTVLAVVSGGVMLLILAAPSSQSAESSTGWKATWSTVLKAAKQEGRVVVLGPPVAGHRQAIAKFRDAFPEIRLEYTGLAPSVADPRISHERRIKKYLWDVMVTGFGPTFYTRQIPAGWYDPIRPVFILPEVLDDKKWLGGLGGGSMDKGKRYGYAFTLNVQKSVYINRDVVPSSSLRTVSDFLDPRWKGKIALYDPRTRGPGGGIFTVLRGILGDEKLRRLVQDQRVTITHDSRQLAEWVVRGRYPIGIGVTSTALGRLQDEGVGLNVKWLRLPVENVTPSWGGAHLMNRAPHPNAAKVFINWLLGRKAQTDWARLGRSNSRRLDVPSGDPDGMPDPRKLHEYSNLSSEAGVKLRVAAIKFAKKIIK